MNRITHDVLVAEATESNPFMVYSTFSVPTRSPMNVPPL